MAWVDRWQEIEPYTYLITKGATESQKAELADKTVKRLKKEWEMARPKLASDRPEVVQESVSVFVNILNEESKKVFKSSKVRMN